MRHGRFWVDGAPMIFSVEVPREVCLKTAGRPSLRDVGDAAILEQRVTFEDLGGAMLHCGGRMAPSS